jgi:Zn-dependent protease
VSARSWDYYAPRSSSNRGAFIPSWVFAALLAACLVGAVLAWRGVGDVGVDVFLFVVAGWLVSLSLHEYAHAIFAYRGGDVSVASKGYLKLNPLKYAHPLLSVVLPILILLLGGIGLPGGAVWINHNAVRSKRAETLISLAGPAVNLLLAVLLSIPFLAHLDDLEHHGFWAGLAFLAFLQLTAAMLNILPVPGLDGGNAVRPWLSQPYDRWFDVFAPYGMLILFALLFEPRVNALFFDVVASFAAVIGLPFDLALDGLDVFRFWS